MTQRDKIKPKLAKQLMLIHKFIYTQRIYVQNFIVIGRKFTKFFRDKRVAKGVARVVLSDNPSFF